MLSRRGAVLSLLAIVSAGVETQARPLEGRYFVVVWAYQGGSGSPTEAHTFATFYRGDDLAAANARPITISWLPATRVVRFGTVEKGKNFSLEETLALARRQHFRVASYGPYEISAATYSRALARASLLNSGKIAYTMINVVPDAMNCIEAAGSVGGPINTGLNYGFAASAVVARHLARYESQVDRDAAARLHLTRQTTAE